MADSAAEVLEFDVVNIIVVMAPVPGSITVTRSRVPGVHNMHIDAAGACAQASNQVQQECIDCSGAIIIECNSFAAAIHTMLPGHRRHYCAANDPLEPRLVASCWDILVLPG